VIAQHMRHEAGRLEYRFRMHMAGDFAGCRGRLVTKRDGSDRHFARDHAAEIGRQLR